VTPRPTTLDATRAALREGSTTVERVTAGFLEAIRAGSRLNAFLDVFDDRAMDQARNVDAKIAAGNGGPLAGMVVAVKDVLCMEGVKTTCGSRILADFVSPYDATAVARLRAADAVLIGKTNMDEFAMGSSTENSAFGPVRNPVNESKVPGGSSGGSCVAVAAGMAHAALGTDTGGSIRQPAAFCGVVGMKPTYGRVSRYGLVALSSSFDSIGPFASCVRDVARVLGVIAGRDDNDETSADVPVPSYEQFLTKDVRGKTVGLPGEAFGEGLSPEIRRAIDACVARLRDGGAIVRDVRLPHSPYTISAYYILMTAEASSNLARYDGARYGYRSGGAKDLAAMYTRSRSEGFGAETKRRIMLGTYVLSAGYYDAYYRKAQRVRRLIQEDFDAAFRDVECLLMPTTPTTAFGVGEKINDPLAMYLSDVYTVSANLAGIPAISVPCGTDGAGLPIGVQVLGPRFGEGAVLTVADFLEQPD